MRRLSSVAATCCDCGRPHTFTRDLKPRPPRALVRTRQLEARYATQLRQIARQAGMIVRAWFPEDEPLDIVATSRLRDQLARYADAITPWARSTASRILGEIAIREKAAWAEQAKAMSRALRQELMNAPTGEMLRFMLGEQVELIRSLPIEAAQRVHKLTLKGLETSTRASEVAREIMRTGEVTQSRANLIARTEVARTSSGLVMARARYVGSVAYIWRTSHDPDVRPSHRRMEGKVVQWDAPPTLDGLTGHAGMLPNCRCFPEPIIPEV